MNQFEVAESENRLAWITMQIVVLFCNFFEIVLKCMEFYRQDFRKNQGKNVTLYYEFALVLLVIAHSVVFLPFF